MKGPDESASKVPKRTHRKSSSYGNVQEMMAKSAITRFPKKPAEQVLRKSATMNETPPAPVIAPVTVNADLDLQAQINF